MQPTQAVHPQVVQVQNTAQVPPSQPSRYSCGAKALGIIQILLTIISVALGITTIVYNALVNVFGGPIWGALLFYLPAGILIILSVIVAQNSRRCVAMVSLIMGILATIAAFGNMVMSTASAVIGPHSEKYRYIQVPLDAVLAVVALVELVVAIVACVYSGLIMKEFPNVTSTVQYVTHSYPQTVVMNQNAAPYMYTTGNDPMNTAQAPVPPAAYSGDEPTADYGNKPSNVP